MRLVAMYGGGDWADASVEHVNVPDGLNLDVAKQEYDSWYQNVYGVQMRAGDKPRYLSFTQWLVAHCGVTIAEVESFNED